MTRAGRRYYRTLFLGVAAMGTLIWAAVDQFDIPVEEMLQLMLGAVLVVGLIIVLAAVTVLLLKGVQHLRRRNGD